MYKFFHYDISEYQLLQKELDQLAKNGYTTNKISYITHFTKTDKPTYFLVDFYTSNNKNDNIRPYVQYYLDNKYELVSNFSNILVFKGHKKIEPRPVKQPIAQSEKSKRLFHFLLSILFFVLIFMFLIMPLKPYHLLTNGNVLYYLAILFIPLAFVYRTFLRWSGIYQLSKSIENKKKFDSKNNYIYYLASTFLPISIIISLLLSPLIDIFNTKQLTEIPSQIVTLSDFEIDTKSHYTIYSKSSIIVPLSYEYVETDADNQNSILVQYYELLNTDSAKLLLEDFLHNPNLLYVDKIIQIDDKNYLGYFENKAYIKIIINNNSITLINTSFEIK